MNEKETRSEQMNIKVTPTAHKRVDNVLRRMGHAVDQDGHVKWDQEKLLQMAEIVEGTLVLDEHENYAEVVKSINQYTSLINSKMISLISDLDTTEARIRSDYEAKLASKESIIKDLQEQRAAQESAKNSAIEDASKSKDAQTIAEKHLSDAEDLLQKSEESVKDKEAIIQMLTGKLKDAEEKLTGYDALRVSEASLREQVSLVLHQKELAEANLKHETDQKTAMQQTVGKQEKQIDALKSELAELHDSYQSLQRDLDEQKRSTEQTLTEQKNVAEQAQALAVERAINKAREEMRAELTQLRDERTRLEVQIEWLRDRAQPKTEPMK